MRAFAGLGIRRRLRDALGAAPAVPNASQGWAWDAPPPDATLRGRTVVVDGWIAREPACTEIVVLRDGVEVTASAARHARSDVPGPDGAPVGFHLEIPIDGTATRVTVGLALRRPGAPLEKLAERTVHVAPTGLPYEDSFWRGDLRGAPLRRDQIYGSGPPVSETSDEMLAIVRRFVGHEVLDLGCGAGPYSEALTRDGRRVHGAEYAEPPARLARARGVSVLRADARRLPFADRTFDSVTAIEVLEHVPDPDGAVAECARVARRNLVVSVPNASVIPHLFPWGVVPWHLLEATHVNFFGAGSLEAMLRRGFAHVQVGYYARTFRFGDAPPLYAHLWAVASHEPFASA